MARIVPQLISLETLGYYFLTSNISEDEGSGEVLEVIEEADDLEDAERIAERLAAEEE